ncbi:MAG: sodium:proton antiporter [Propionibacteriaceae bacterium]|jgi:Na+/H+ antiporter NhaD/arsenite permease-like protein|nr:sodium:proton antiporter [Propionibacteriaceae bacterium]
MVGWWLTVPFVVMLVAIAVLPLLRTTHRWWDNPGHQLIVSGVLGVPVAVAMIILGHPDEVAHALIEYGQFVILLLGLFTIAGGIALTGDLAGSPKVNTIFLGVGTLLASFIGTTGAAMLLIRPLLISNAHRRHRAHLVVFGIFTMANCGGLLTPLGDPPLFLGLLRGVPFTWTLSLWPQWLFVNVLLLFTFYCLDCALASPEETSVDVVEPLGIKGGVQIIWFAVVIAAVAFVPSTHWSQGPTYWVDLVPWRELVIVAAAGLSWVTSNRRARFDINHFAFTPIKEVAALFVGIFLTMIPALMLLDEHADSLPLNAVAFHLMTGGLSAVLDNAPTYASFFSVAQGAAAHQAGAALVAGVPVAFLAAVSTGAVFWGAMTYIGNGPNFMLRAIAVNQRVRMPSFVGYLAWSGRWLLPVLVASMMVFIADATWAHVVGVVLAVLVVVRAWLIRSRVDWIRCPGAGDPQSSG